MQSDISFRVVAVRLIGYPLAVFGSALMVAGSVWFPKLWAVTHPGEFYQLLTRSGPTPITAYPSTGISEVLVEQASEWGLVWMHQTHFQEVLSLTLLVSVLAAPIAIWALESEPPDEGGEGGVPG